ncbi:MAG: uroporphyrinogen-III C-methyltransferase [Woeseiaceae bacterium]|nr:uroporphyrinogen-III C-methyltransferase [Woeseiaceae bacterium]
MSGIESQIAALQGVAGGLRDTWLLAEAEYYLQIANAQLTLANNVDVARTALELADERLASLGDSSLVTVRQQVSDELRALDAVDTVDIESAALTLSSLTDATRSLPLRTDVVRPDFDDPAVSDDLSGPARRVGRSQEFPEQRHLGAPQRPPGQTAAAARRGLLPAQQSRAATAGRPPRAAARRRRSCSGRVSTTPAAGSTNTTIRDSTPVQSALDTIDELRELQVTATLPDISRSLELLRQQVALQRRERLRDGGSEGSNGPGQ